MEYDVLIVSLAAFFAGFIDAIVGGGGLIQVPIMFLVFPQMPVSVVIGTNRSASFVGTLMAGYQYAKSTPYYVESSVFCRNNSSTFFIFLCVLCALPLRLCGKK